MIHYIENETDFYDKLSSAGELLVVVDWFATWCGPCQKTNPKVQLLAETYKDKIMILKVDTDKCRDLKLKHRIEYVPTFIFFWNGERLDGIVDEADVKKVESYVLRYLATSTC